MSLKDREAVRDFYDELADAEWPRLQETTRGRVSFEVHRRFLSGFVTPGDRVFEIGAGPGRFIFELAALGARLCVTDFSTVQLELHRSHLARTPAEDSVESRALLDACDTSRYADGEFDAVVAFGDPLSYAFEDVDEALSGLLRVTKPGGVVVASVMSLLGLRRYFLRGVLEDSKVAGEGSNDLVLATGDLRHFNAPHTCQLFRAREVSELVARCSGDVVAMSASNWASLGDADALVELEADEKRWERFLEHKVAACQEPGALDGGTHLLFAASHSAR